MTSGRALLFVCLLSTAWAQNPAPRPAAAPNPPDAKLAVRAPENRAGAVAALVPRALRNETVLVLKEDVYWHDVLRTAPEGRMRVLLRDGSVLSLGANSTLLVVRHDAVAQRTVLGLVNGTLRGRIAPQVMRGSEFRIHTRTAVIGVVGTDFLVEALEQKTVITCFAGMVGVRDVTGERKALLRAGEQLDFDGASRPRVRNQPKDQRRHGQDDTHIDGLDDADLHVEAKLERSLDSKKDKPGDKVGAKTTREIRLADGTVLPKGSELVGSVAQVRKRSETDSARLAVVFEQAVSKDGRTVPLRATVQAVRAPYSERLMTLGEARQGRVEGRQREQTYAQAMRSYVGDSGGTAAGEGGPAAAGSGGGSGGGGGDDHGGSGGGDSGGGGGGGGDIGGGGTGGTTSSDDSRSTSGSGLDDSRSGVDDKTTGLENESERVSGEDRLSGGADDSAELASNFHVAGDDDLDESSHGVGGIADTRLLFHARDQGYDAVLVSATGNIYVAKGSDLVLRIEPLAPASPPR